MAGNDATELGLQFKSGEIALAASLTIPRVDGPLPSVLMLPGSGQTDRDSNAKQLKINLFRPIVGALASQGIASFRYDKRGVGSSGGNYWTTGFHDLYDDAEAAIGFLASRPEIDPKRIYVLGHSEGAMLSLMLAARSGKVAGAVLLAGAAKTGEETILWQTREIAASLTGLNRLILKLLHIDVVGGVSKNLARIKSTKRDSLRIQGRMVNAKWMREFLDHDPKTNLEELRVPTLALTGSSDVQVDPEDIEEMVRLAPRHVDGKVLDGLSHLLRPDLSGSGLKGYRKQAKQPVDNQVLEIVSNWLSVQARSTN